MRTLTATLALARYGWSENRSAGWYQFGRSLLLPRRASAAWPITRALRTPLTKALQGD